MEKLNDIVDFLNKKFNQGSEEYSIFKGANPQVIRFDNETAISLWACGAIVCINKLVYFIQEDDGNWFAPKYIKLENANSKFWKNHPYIGLQTCFSLGWSESFINAFKSLNDYVKENGVPYYYPSTDIICGYELK